MNCCPSTYLVIKTPIVFKIFHSDMYLNQLVMSKYSYFISMAQYITCCISSDHGILDGHEEDVDPLMLLIQDIMDILYGIRNENRHSLLTVLRKNLLPEWLQGWQVLRRPLAPLCLIFVRKLVGHNLDSPHRHLKDGKPVIQ